MSIVAVFVGAGDDDDEENMTLLVVVVTVVLCRLWERSRSFNLDGRTHDELSTLTRPGDERSSPFDKPGLPHFAVSTTSDLGRADNVAADFLAAPSIDSDFGTFLRIDLSCFFLSGLSSSLTTLTTVVVVVVVLVASVESARFVSLGSSGGGDDDEHDDAGEADA